MPRCPDCGAEVERSQRFCHECWGTLDASADEETTSSTATSGQNGRRKRLAWLSGVLGGRTTKIVVGVVLIAVVAVVALAVSVGIGGLVVGDGGANTTDDTGYNATRVQAEAVGMEYDTLFRNIKQYHGTSVHYEGEIQQVIDEGDDEYTILVGVTETQDGHDDTLSVEWSGKRFLEDDVIAFSGVVEGTRTYTTSLGVIKTVPELTAVSVEIAA